VGMETLRMPIRSPVPLLCFNLAPTTPSVSLPHPRCAISTLPLRRAMLAASATIARRVSQSIHGKYMLNAGGCRPPAPVGTHRSAPGPTPTSLHRLKGLRENSPAREGELAFCRSPAASDSVQSAADGAGRPRRLLAYGPVSHMTNTHWHAILLSTRSVLSCTRDVSERMMNSISDTRPKSPTRRSSRASAT
jgi:hypothetical protein